MSYVHDIALDGTLVLVGDCGHEIVMCEGMPKWHALVDEARAWVADCGFYDVDPEDVPHYSAHTILVGVNRIYDGGLVAFINDISEVLA